MAPFRPTNINKRAYPGNANVVGPTCVPTLGITTTFCCTFQSTLCGPTCYTYTLGCRNLPISCSCCPCCCCCSCTVCDRIIGAGMWSQSEVLEASSRCAWGDDICVTGSQIGFCGPSGTISGSTCDCRGFLICCTPSRKWFVAPSCTQVGRGWYQREDAVTTANSLMGACGWFVPDLTQVGNPGYSCRSFWDSYTGSYWSSTQYSSHQAWRTNFSNGNSYFSHKLYCAFCVRTLRCPAT